MTHDEAMQKARAWLTWQCSQEDSNGVPRDPSVESLADLLMRVGLEAKIRVHEDYEACDHSPAWAECRLVELRAQLQAMGEV